MQAFGRCSHGLQRHSCNQNSVAVAALNLSTALPTFLPRRLPTAARRVEAHARRGPEQRQAAAHAGCAEQLRVGCWSL